MGPLMREYIYSAVGNWTSKCVIGSFGGGRVSLFFAITHFTEGLHSAVTAAENVQQTDFCPNHKVSLYLPIFRLIIKALFFDNRSNVFPSLLFFMKDQSVFWIIYSHYKELLNIKT